MAITLRTITGSALTYQQIDDNFSSLFYSASYSASILQLHYPQSVLYSYSPVSIDLGAGNVVTWNVLDPATANLEYNAQITGSLTVTGDITSGVTSNQSNKVTTTSTPEVINTVNTGSYISALVQYGISKSGNSRAGQMFISWNGTSAIYTDNSSGDIGDTSQVLLSAAINGSDLEITATTSTTGWDIRTAINLL